MDILKILGSPRRKKIERGILFLFKPPLRGVNDSWKDFDDSFVTPFFFDEGSIGTPCRKNDDLS
ncbi:hypothetical protein CH380_05745 [Leptospira adleri]|uniref:Uncharacterized protein n=1 Tax=Leptospira adleri TaxID=2023186 RepID=A0A2M9YR57_9LEPT|nr:hypothetical protein CH380_05745 [Leptospira adleri]PJZ63347.1 hypothetical protein CH376_03665 [Leptospira adleri]